MDAIALLIGITVLGSAIVIWIWDRTKKRLLRAVPVNRMRGTLTPTGIALNACFGIVLVLGAAGRKVAPESELGKFLNLPYGVPVAMGIAVVVFGVLAGILHGLGHPMVKEDANRDA